MLISSRSNFACSTAAGFQVSNLAIAGWLLSCSRSVIAGCNDIKLHLARPVTCPSPALLFSRYKKIRPTQFRYRPASPKSRTSSDRAELRPRDKEILFPRQTKGKALPQGRTSLRIAREHRQPESFRIRKERVWHGRLAITDNPGEHDNSAGQKTGKHKMDQ